MTEAIAYVARGRVPRLLRQKVKAQGDEAGPWRFPSPAPFPGRRRRLPERDVP